jgi:hypothetical protein
MRSRHRFADVEGLNREEKIARLMTAVREVQGVTEFRKPQSATAPKAFASRQATAFCG